MSEEHTPLLREFHIQRMVHGQIKVLTIKAENISQAKLYADEMASGDPKGFQR